MFLQQMVVFLSDSLLVNETGMQLSNPICSLVFCCTVNLQVMFWDSSNMFRILSVAQCVHTALPVQQVHMSKAPSQGYHTRPRKKKDTFLSFLWPDAVQGGQAALRKHLFPGLEHKTFYRNRGGYTYYSHKRCVFFLLEFSFTFLYLKQINMAFTDQPQRLN